jgi:molybdopterin/thiamine biosynthesis adenylyltransferase
VLIGLGGIGSPALQYLAGAGVGRLVLVDDDRVDASNLQRQTIFTEADTGLLKVERAGAWLEAFDPAIAVQAVAIRARLRHRPGC